MSDHTQTDNDTPVVDTVGAAQFVGMSAHYIVKHSSGGVKPQIPYLKIGNRLRFKISELKNFVESRTKKG